MSCCSISKARRKLQSNIESTFDSVQKEAERINRKTKAEVSRIPNNIDKGVSSAQAKIGSSVRGGVRNIRETAGEVLSIIPGLKGAGQFVKFLGIGLIALLAVSIIRRARK